MQSYEDYDYKAKLKQENTELKEKLEDLPRTPTEIKKDIKHNKRNPMRLKQLNKELNDSYKWYKRNRGKANDGR